MSVDADLAYLTKGTVDVVRLGELRAKLERSRASEDRHVRDLAAGPREQRLSFGLASLRGQRERCSIARLHRVEQCARDRVRRRTRSPASGQKDQEERAKLPSAGHGERW